jgi:hypothetical protein
MLRLMMLLLLLAALTTYEVYAIFRPNRATTGKKTREQDEKEAPKTWHKKAFG